MLVFLLVPLDCDVSVGEATTAGAATSSAHARVEDVTDLQLLRHALATRARVCTNNATTSGYCVK
jgi:hypothetical protein